VTDGSEALGGAMSFFGIPSEKSMVGGGCWLLVVVLTCSNHLEKYDVPNHQPVLNVCSLSQL